MTETARREPHAALDVSGRLSKARKIEHFLDLPHDGRQPVRMLEIGTGSGAIAHYFSKSGPSVRVTAVDVVDQRQQADGYDFRLVEGVELPFADAAFDAVISNHVLEHVGERAAQLTHLREISRVLAPAGSAYLASPNRWQIVEPHYRLAFLSWLPHPVRSAYLALAGKGKFYDCEPLQKSELERLLHEAGLAGRNICVPALRYMLAAEPRQSVVARAASAVPDRWLERLNGMCPTHIYLLRHAASPA